MRKFEKKKKYFDHLLKYKQAMTDFLNLEVGEMHYSVARSSIIKYVSTMLAKVASKNGTRIQEMAKDLTPFLIFIVLER